MSRKHDWSYSVTYVAYFSPGDASWKSELSDLWLAICGFGESKVVDAAYFITLQTDDEAAAVLQGDPEWVADSVPPRRRSETRRRWHWKHRHSGLLPAELRTRLFSEHKFDVTRCDLLELRGYSSATSARTGDVLWELVASKCPDDAKTTCIRIRAPRDAVRSIDEDAITRLHMDIFSTIDRLPGALSGFIDYARGEENDLGGHHEEGDSWSVVPFLSRLLEKACWLQQENKYRTKHRGIFWGNYFGTSGPVREYLLDMALSYKQVATENAYPDDSPIIERMPTGGLLLSLTPYCTDIEPEELVARLDCFTERGAWLHRYLRKRDLLV